MQGRRSLLSASESLSQWTTLRLGGPAGQWSVVQARQQLYDTVAAADQVGQPVLVLGGGSNLVVADSGFDGLVVRVETKGLVTEAGTVAPARIDVGAGVEAADQPGGVEVTVEAGESWDDFVARVVAQQLVGVEALAGIPGTVGAVPIQNVGAYGQEVADSIVRVHVLDRLERHTRVMSAVECGFGYRTSRFKQEPGRFVVGAVTFRFRSGALGAPVTYAELARTLGVTTGERAPASDIRSAVLGLRAAKGMVLDEADPDTWSAGSFFTNPFVAAEQLPRGAPAYPQPDGSVKTSAAWLIERAGFHRGFGNERARLSSKHTLALTNRGSASTQDLLALARQVRDGVETAYGIRLQVEPVLVGCQL